MQCLAVPLFVLFFKYALHHEYNPFLMGLPQLGNLSF